MERQENIDISEEIALTMGRQMMGLIRLEKMVKIRDKMLEDIEKQAGSAKAKPKS